MAAVSAPALIDLHVHSALSPCAAEEMKPPAALLMAERRGVTVLGVVDHCSARNAGAFIEAAPAFDLRLLVGLEIESAEGVHILALFDNLDAAMAMDESVAERLPDLANRPSFFGEQHLLDEWGQIVGMDGRLLVTACELSIEEVAALTASLGGISIPAHIERAAYGLLPTLGFAPPGLEVDAFELSRWTSPAQARERWPELRGRALLTGSDAHCLDEIGRGEMRIAEELARAALPAREWMREIALALAAEGTGPGA